MSRYFVQYYTSERGVGRCEIGIICWPSVMEWADATGILQTWFMSPGHEYRFDRGKRMFWVNHA